MATSMQQQVPQCRQHVRAGISDADAPGYSDGVRAGRGPVQLHSRPPPPWAAGGAAGALDLPAAHNRPRLLPPQGLLSLLSCSRRLRCNHSAHSSVVSYHVDLLRCMSRAGSPRCSTELQRCLLAEPCPQSRCFASTTHRHEICPPKCCKYLGAAPFCR